jgi:hypothetical protein
MHSSTLLLCGVSVQEGFVQVLRHALLQ